MDVPTSSLSFQAPLISGAPSLTHVISIWFLIFAFFYSGLINFFMYFPDADLRTVPFDAACYVFCILTKVFHVTLSDDYFHCFRSYWIIWYWYLISWPSCWRVNYLILRSYWAITLTTIYGTLICMGLHIFYYNLHPIFNKLSLDLLFSPIFNWHIPMIPY
jgi:hypothetical protein